MNSITKLLVTGGTGSFGNAIIEKYLKKDIEEIRVFSRDEKKQDSMRRHFNDVRLKFFLGDVRDESSLTSAIIGVDSIFHAAALKQVPSCDFFPMQAVNTNILGTDNVLRVATREGIPKLVCLSTDKAVYPVNAMGISKALMERVILAGSREQNSTKACITRYGNVMASRGSVIPLFAALLKGKKPLTVTDLQMTRFMMSLEQAVDLVEFAFHGAKTGSTVVRKAPACTIETLIEAMADIFINGAKPEIKIIGIRHGEKMHETLLSEEEMVKSQDAGDYFVVAPDRRDLNYDQYFGNENQSPVEQVQAYQSDNTERLDKKSTIEMLMSAKNVRDLLE